MTHTLHKRKLVSVSILLFIAITASWILFLPGVPFGHDFSFHLTRINSIAEGMRHGQLLLRVYPDLYQNYGYACGIFYGDFFLNIPAFLVFCGLDLILSYKLFIFLTICATVFTSYYASVLIFGRRVSGLICAAFYVLSSYFIYDTYLRAALGEMQAFVFFPLAIAGIRQLIYEKRNGFLLTVIGFSGLVLSHLISFLLAVGVALLLLIFSFPQLRRNPRRLFVLFLAAGLTGLLTAFFILPMLEQMALGGITVQETTVSGQMAASVLRIRNLFVNVSDSPLVAPGVVMPGIGLGFFLLFPLRLAAGWPRDDLSRFRDFCLAAGTFALFATTSLFPWTFFEPYLSFLQFPWRLLFPASLLLSFAAAGLASQLFNLKFKLHRFLFLSVLLVLALPAICLSMNIYRTSAQTESPEDRYHTAQSIEDGGMLYFSLAQCKFVDSLYFHQNQTEPFFYPEPDENFAFQGNTTCRFERNYGVLTLYWDNPSDRPEILELPINYVLGYQVKSEDSQSYPLSVSHRGLLTCEVPPSSKGSLAVSYGGTIIQHLSTILSFSTAVGLGVWKTVSMRRKKRKKISKTDTAPLGTVS